MHCEQVVRVLGIGDVEDISRVEGRMFCQRLTASYSLLGDNSSILPSPSGDVMEFTRTDPTVGSTVTVLPLISDLAW